MRRSVATLVLAFGVLSPKCAQSKITPWTNLAGVRGIQPTISVSLDVEGAQDLDLQSNQIKTVATEQFTKSGLLSKPGTAAPQLYIVVSGRGTGGGGADYSIELLLTAHLASPFTSNHGIEVIIWRSSMRDSQNTRYDPVSKKLVNVPGTPKDRMIGSLKEILAKLIADIGKANPAR
jgi:hypothetical protein